MIYTVQLTEQAKQDLRGIYEYIALTLFEPETAKNLINPVGHTLIFFEWAE